MAPLTDGQVIALIIINIVSSSLSIGGSCTIVYLVSIAKKPSVYNRMLFGLSMCDILHSICLLISPFLLPAEGGRIWAHGNDQTCTMLGFFVQLGVTVPLYNASLNAFFLLTIVYGISETKIRKWAEPTMHAVPILYPLVTASIGVGISLYSENELGLTCWIGEYPRGCDTNPDVECVSTIIGWIYAGIPHAGTLVFLIISNAMIYRKVRITTRQSDRYCIESIEAPQTDTEPATDSVSTDDEVIDVQRGCCIGLTARARTYFKQMNVPRSRQNEVGRIEPVVSIIGTPRETPAQIPQRRRRASVTSRGNRKTRAVAKQATLYVVACFSTMIWMLILRTLESSGVTSEEESGIYWIVVMTKITYPLEGFWNLLIFVGPKYRRYRRNEPKRSRWWALRQCLSKPGNFADRE